MEAEIDAVSVSRNRMSSKNSKNSKNGHDSTSRKMENATIVVTTLRVAVQEQENLAHTTA